MVDTVDTRTRDRRADHDTVMEIRDVSVTYDRDRGRATVLNDCSIDLRRGETLGVVGESGCGKSMFASALLDAIPEPGMLHGEVTYYPEDGDPVDLLELSRGELKGLRWEEISMVFQGAMNSFNPTKPIRDHFVETIDAHGADREARLEWARQVMRDLSMDPDRILEAHQHELSGGQRQRVLIALSLLLDPEVLVLDEPTGALDLLIQRAILRMLYEIKDEYDLTLVLISHDLPIVSAFADRLGVMYAFEFVELGRTEDVIRNAAHPYTRALLRSTPSLDTPIDAVETVDGSAPDPINIPTGCPYHPRCPIADDRCEIEKPDLVGEEDEQRAACFYVDQSRNDIPMPFSWGETE